MTNRSILGAVAVASAGIALALVPSVAVAGPPPPGGGPGGPGDTVYVNNHNGGVSSAASPKQNAAGCANTTFTDVQSAVNAAKPGQTVYLCASTAPYSGWVVIQKNLKLTGDPGATIQAPAGAEGTVSYFDSQGMQAPNAIVGVFGNVNVQISGVTIQGPLSGCGNEANQDFGVLALGGPHVQLNNDSVLHITENSDCVLAFAVDGGAESWPGSSGVLTANLQVQNTSISDYQDVGVIVDGSGSQGEVMGTTVQGDGTSALDAQVGIVVQDGAGGHVHNDTISDNESSSPQNAVGTGVEVAGGCGSPLTKNVEVDHNTITNNDDGVAVSELDDSCSLPPAQPTHVNIHDNAISKNDGVTNHTTAGNSPYTGYQVGISDIGNGDDIHNNTITDMGGAYGPLTAAGGPFLAPIDVQTYPTTNPKVHNNTFDGHPTNPPY